MNYPKSDLSAGRSIALYSPEVPPRRGRRWPIPHAAIAPIAMACDAIVILFMSIASGVAYHLYALDGFGNVLKFAGLAAVVALLFVALAKSNHLYDVSQLLTLRTQIRLVALKWTGLFLFLSAVAFMTKAGAHFSRGATLSFAISGLVALIGTRVVWRIALAHELAIRTFSGQRVVLVADESAAADSDFIQDCQRQGLQLIRRFVLPSNGKNWNEQIKKVVLSVRGSNVDEIVLHADVVHWPRLRKALSELRVLPLPVTLVPTGPISDLLKFPIHTIGNSVSVELQRRPRSLFERFTKRMIDIILSGTAIILLTPLLVMTTIAIKLDSPGPAIFRQRRCGFNGTQFYIFKFRTMTVQEDGERIRSAQLHDSRVTRIGTWLRRTSIDELPQLFNVLQGNMSIIGPRPHALAHDNEFNKLVRKYAYRQHVKPGITGWAQINGHRGSMNTVVDVEKRIQFDLWYIENWSLALDFKILLLTVIEVFRAENAY